RAGGAAGARAGGPRPRRRAADRAGSVGARGDPVGVGGAEARAERAGRADALGVARDAPRPPGGAGPGARRARRRGAAAAARAAAAPRGPLAGGYLVLRFLAEAVVLCTWCRTISARCRWLWTWCALAHMSKSSHS